MTYFRLDIERIAREVHQAHINREDVPVGPLKPRPFKRRPRPNTALIWEACMAKREEREAAAKKPRKKIA